MPACLLLVRQKLQLSHVSSAHTTPFSCSLILRQVLTKSPKFSAPFVAQAVLELSTLVLLLLLHHHAVFTVVGWHTDLALWLLSSVPSSLSPFPSQPSPLLSLFSPSPSSLSLSSPTETAWSLELWLMGPACLSQSNRCDYRLMSLMGEIQ